MTYTERKLVQNVFGDWVEPQEHTPPRCISIPITPQIRALDAARQAARNVAITWKRPESVPEPIHPRQHYVFPAGRSDGKRRSTKTKNPPKRRHDRPEPRHCVCGRTLQRCNPRTTCSRCWRKSGNPERLAKRVLCEAGCGRMLRPGREGGLCGICHWKRSAPEVKRRWRERKKVLA